MSLVSDLHEKWSKDPDYRRAYDELGPEFAASRSLVKARFGAGLTQERLGKFTRRRGRAG